MEGNDQLVERTYVWEHTDDDGVFHVQMTMLAVQGRAGAASFTVMGGNHRVAQEANPLGAVSKAEEMVALELAPVGVELYSYRPWPGQLEYERSEGLRPLDGASGYVHQVDGLSLLLSSRLLTRFVQPGGIKAVFSELRDQYVEAFMPEATGEDRAREAAALAKAKAEGAQFAHKLSEDGLEFVLRDVLMRAGIAELRPDGKVLLGGPFANEFEGLWMDTDVARAAGLLPDPEPEPEPASE